MRKEKDMPKGEVVIYKSPEGDTEINVSLKDETVWLNINQMVSLFQRDKSVISRHISNIFKEKELLRDSTVAKFATVQKEGERDIKRGIEHYNLDVIISIGYRVKSKRGTQFRIWANKVLKDYLVKGYVLNENRLKEQTDKIKDLERSLEIIQRLTNIIELQKNEFSGILQVITDYTHALDILDSYDHQRLKIKDTEKEELYKITYDDSIDLIKIMQKDYGASGLFGKEKDKSFKSAVANIYQTFGKKELYPSIEEKAANLLYMIIKNHGFVDGNKRIAATIFLMYLARNKYLYRPNGEKRIADNALVALCLMIAESSPKEKDTIIKVIVNLINKKN
jgi:death-on-curing family protein